VCVREKERERVGRDAVTRERRERGGRYREECEI